jgi:hypothetical protein
LDGSDDPIARPKRYASPLSSGTIPHQVRTRCVTSSIGEKNAIRASARHRNTFFGSDSAKTNSRGAVTPVASSSAARSDSRASNSRYVTLLVAA